MTPRGKLPDKEEGCMKRKGAVRLKRLLVGILVCLGLCGCLESGAAGTEGSFYDQLRAQAGQYLTSLGVEDFTLGLVGRQQEGWYSVQVTSSSEGTFDVFITRSGAGEIRDNLSLRSLSRQMTEGSGEHLKDGEFCSAWVGFIRELPARQWTADDPLSLVQEEDAIYARWYLLVEEQYAGELAQRAARLGAQLGELGFTGTLYAAAVPAEKLNELREQAEPVQADWQDAIQGGLRVRVAPEEGRSAEQILSELVAG